MSAELALAAGERLVLAGATARERSRDRRFFTGMAIAAALTVFVGFAPSYYLSAALRGRPLSTLVHVHGAVSTAWILLFLTQTSLIAAGRTDLHRRLGVAGALLATLLLVVGYLTAIEGARRGATPPGGPPPLAFLAVPIGTLITFAILVGTGLRQRRKSETHKRLMLLATISILTPALAGMRFIGSGGPPVGHRRHLPVRGAVPGLRSRGALPGAPRLPVGRPLRDGLLALALRARADGRIALGGPMADGVTATPALLTPAFASVRSAPERRRTSSPPPRPLRPPAGRIAAGA
jgi:uncharacterized membrane protein YozB (DUF420 family)